MAELQSDQPKKPALSDKRERGLLWLLAFTQFTVITDFVIMMPLGPQIMEAFSVGPAAFATAVSAYSWCSGLSGLMSATYIDRFDRKRLLLVVYALFALSNLGCALASSFSLMVLSRAFAGFTGGVMGALVMAIVADVIPAQRRGTATGLIMTAFPMAAVAGVPLGVFLGARHGWQSPFYVLVLVSVLIWVIARYALPRLNAHLAQRRVPMAEVLPQLWALLREPRHLRAFALSGPMMMSGMLVIPFISPVFVANLHLKPEDLSWVYMAGGLATLFTARAVGRLSDRYGAVRVFRVLALVSALPLVAVTYLPAWPLWGLMLFFPLFMVPVSGRVIPMQALLSTVPAMAQRGAFMSVNNAIQSLGVGCAVWVGGLLLSNGPGGRVEGYHLNGWLALALTAWAMFWIGRVRPTIAGAH
ncbi:MFS transporter [Roseateles toxinivorans]|uniref:Putative MFS family arabinose efflux permease n=1 Tax=Roseateles toxinivorans TaxID=270368 RepID=A0A4R6QJK5_9BURK|nr:MFS transporter [Roseateles toxinivorans]TDP63906.1 putative MFS family arabinose efflux permease [Roseateles toxinivorans]